MNVGIGIDLVKNDRIKNAVEKWNQRFLNRVFTPSERDYAFSKKTPYPHLAARFALKEAVMKALGRGLGSGPRWKEISVTNRREAGRSTPPELKITGKTRELMESLGFSETRFSLSHDTDYSIAQVFMFGGSKPPVQGPPETEGDLP